MATIGWLRSYNVHRVAGGLPGEHDNLRSTSVVELVQAAPRLRPGQPVLQAAGAGHGAKRSAPGNRDAYCQHNIGSAGKE